MAFLRDINGMIPEIKLFFNLRIIGDATSDFVLDRLFKLNTFEITGHTNSKLGIIYQHTKVWVIGR